jgi:putative ABC transport system ATP-binding protein
MNADASKGEAMDTLLELPVEPPHPEMARPLYELRGVERAFESGGTVLKAVAGIDLEIYPGEFVAIEGPSGSGKTTLLQLLGGLDKATEGTVRFADVEMTEIDDTELTRLRARDFGFVFQGFNLIPTLSAAENVEAAMVTDDGDRRARRERVAELLALVGLAERSHHLPSKLSGGEQQRVAIARALANGPRVILADEPTGNLDSATAVDVVDALAALSADRGVTVVVVTHSGEVAGRAERRVRMRDGRIVDGS